MKYVKIFFIVLFFILAIGMIAQKKTYSYVFVLTVENMTAEEGVKFNDEIYELQKKYNFKIDFYQKNDFDKRMVIPDFKMKSK